MQPHQERVVAERTELTDRLAKLAAFVGGGIYRTLDEAEQDRLIQQLVIMNQYVEILNDRIAAFPKD
jgi:hypothetical protein